MARRLELFSYLVMLLECWNDVVARRSGQVALWHPQVPEGLTFRDIDGMAAEVDASGPFVVAVGESPRFFPSLLAAWRAGKPAILVETKTSKIRPIPGGIPSGTALIKQTCGASGIERSLFFEAAQVFAEGQRNLGVVKGDRAIAAISLAHSYGFGCLALPLLLNGLTLDVVPGPLPMFMQASLDRAPEGGVFLPAVPAIWKSWSQTGVTRHPAIGLALSAGSPLSLELEQAIYQDGGLKVHNFYGTSETGAVAFDDSNEVRTRPDFVGRALPGVEVWVDEGERIMVGCDSRATGTDYPASSDEFGASVYRTFDQGAVTSAGVFVRRSIGEAINVAGRKVSPGRLRGMIEQLEGVRSATVGRGPSRDYERFEEIQVRLVVGADYDKRSLRERLREKVESWEMPRHWEFEIEQVRAD